ncbi:MAG: MATE family efflux transporter [Gemmatimonadales bacterium]
MPSTDLDIQGPRGLRQELAAMVRLALPVVVVQVGLMAMGVVDTMMVGRVSASAIAAVALGNVYFFAVAIFGQGVLMALDPIVAQAVGAGDDVAIARGVQRGLILAVGLSVATSLLLLPAASVLSLLRQPTEFATVAARYDVVSIAGVLPFYVFVVFRQALQAMHRMAPIVWSIIVGNLANILLNWMLVFGHLGAPPMGAVGSAWGTAAGRLLLAVVLIIAAWPRLKPYVRPFRDDAFAVPALRRMFALGWPIGVQLSLEFGVFGLVGLLMGWMGTRQMAGHQIALNIASFTFMVPLGVSGAAAVLVGNAVGRGDAAEARRAAAAGLICGAGFMAVSAAGMLAAPAFFARLYTSDVAVAAMAAALIPLAGVFQVFDGIQVVSIGILRGVADTRWPMIVNILGFWLIGLPVSLWLGFRTDLGPRGLWWGLVLGLALVAVMLLLRARNRLDAPMHRVRIDHEEVVAR